MASLLAFIPVFIGLLLAIAEPAKGKSSLREGENY